MKKAVILSSAVGAAVILSAASFATIIHVPGDSATIQAGIDGAVSGDTVLVADGTYTGNGNRDIDFGGKGIVLKSENGADFTIIDCQGTAAEPHRGFNFHSGEDSTAVVDGFTIQGGYGPFDGPGGRSVGGGIKCDSSSSPSLINNTISGNMSKRGGGICCSNYSSPTISNNTVSGNWGLYWGGGISCWYSSSPTISNNTISGNLGGFYDGGGGISCNVSSSPTISNNTISGNSAGYGGGISCNAFSGPIISNNTISGNSTFEGSGGGIYCYYNSSPTISNTIIAFSAGGEAVYCDGSSNPVLTCCDIYCNEGGDWVGCIAGQADTNGNLSADPLFCDTATGDFHLDIFSPCLTSSPFNSCGVLIGALDVGCNHGFVCGDANGDSVVTMDDVLFLQAFYFDCGPCPYPCLASDVNCDGSVDIADIVYLAQFLNSTGPEPCCW